MEVPLGLTDKVRHHPNVFSAAKLLKFGNCSCKVHRMFCPTCGKDNSLELKYCASCGTDLEAVSQALSGREDDFFTKMDAGMDHFIARYSEHVFKNAPHTVSVRKVSASWKLLGQAVLTSLIDVLLFALMWNLLPLRFLILLISTPFRLMAERSRIEEGHPQAIQGYSPPELREAQPSLWLGETAPGVTEDTTANLDNALPTKPGSAGKTEPLK
jgi:hypothetical protein